MSFCGTLTQGATYNCNSPLQPGLEPRIILINSADVQSVTITDNKITDIVLYPTKTGYLFEGIKQSIKAEHEKGDTGLTNGYIHKTHFQVYDISTDQKKNLERLSKGNVLAIVFNRNKPGNYDSYFEVFGYGAGMQPNELSRMNRGLETQGSITVNLETPEEYRESKIPLTFFDTDYDTTLQKILDLLDAGDNNVFPFVFPFNLA